MLLQVAFSDLYSAMALFVLKSSSYLLMIMFSSHMSRFKAYERDL